MGVDRRTLPPPGDPPPARFPEIGRETLAGGTRLWTAPHRDQALVSVALLLPAGSAADPPGAEGLAGFTAALLDEGTRSRPGMRLHEALGRIGGRLAADVTSDATILSVSALSRYARDALALLVEMATEPRFDPADVDRVRAIRLNRIAQRRHVAGAVADRAHLKVLYGSHPYGHPPIGEEQALGGLGTDDVRAFHAAHYGPARWTVIAVGAADVLATADLVGALGPPANRRAAGARRGAGASEGAPPAGHDGARRGTGEPGVPGAPPVPATRLTFIAREGAVQSEIRIGQLGVARRVSDYPAITLMNMVLGGQFVSRLNLNLREARGYTYGVGTAFDARRGRGPFTLRTAVDAGVTVEAVREAIREVCEIRDIRPVTEDELEVARPALTRGFARNFETAAQVARGAMRLAMFDLPDDEYATFVPRVAAVDAEQVTRAASRHLDPDALSVVVVGPPEVRPSLGRLGLGEPVEP